MDRLRPETAAPNLAVLETLARQAGEVLRTGFGARQQIDRKGTIDLVTEMDRRSEALLLNAIKTRYPSHRLISEELGVLEGDARQVWYIDPLDGTINYAHGVPIFSVSLAYAEDEELILGVVYDPMRDECFSAQRGHGAWLNGVPIHVSSQKDLDQSLLVTGFPYDIRTHPENNLDHYAHFALLSQGVRRLGSAAIDLCYVAAGRFEGYWEVRLNIWDLAAGALILEEAGGVLTRLDGSPDYLYPPYSVLGANPYIHPQMLGELSRVRI